MNAKDLITLTEYLSAFNTKQPKQRREQKEKRKEFDLVSLLRKKEEEVDIINKFLEERSKLKKKEEKKEDKKHTFTFAEGVILAIVAQMFIGPMYKMFLLHLGIQ